MGELTTGDRKRHNVPGSYVRSGTFVGCNEDIEMTAAVPSQSVDKYSTKELVNESALSAFTTSDGVADRGNLNGNSLPVGTRCGAIPNSK